MPSEWMPIAELLLGPWPKLKLPDEYPEPLPPKSPGDPESGPLSAQTGTAASKTAPQISKPSLCFICPSPWPSALQLISLPSIPNTNALETASVRVHPAILLFFAEIAPELHYELCGANSVTLP